MQIQGNFNDGNEVVNIKADSHNKQDKKLETKSPVNKKDVKGKKKTKEFKDRELEEMRNEFARKQGVKGVIVSTDQFAAIDPIKEDIALKADCIQADDKDQGVEDRKGARPKVEESLYEPVGEEREEFLKNRLTPENQINDSPLVDDNIIGFDLNTNHIEPTEDSEVTATTEEEQNQEPPILPSRRKTSKNSNSQLSVEEKILDKEKKSSFIKEWQKDLKDFFTLRKKKISNTNGNAPNVDIETTPNDTVEEEVKR